MPVPDLPAEAIVVRATVSNWREAVSEAGAALSRAGFTLPGYAAEMVRMIEEHGPYVVIAPGLALAHARPGPDVLADGLAILTLETPVNFGHPHNDPVSVVLALAVATAEAHVALVAELANIFNDSTAIQSLTEATSVEEIQRVMKAER